MTPNRRLDQLEPLMADALQKIDRLIEGQGQLVELVINTKVGLDEVKGDLTEVKEDLTEVRVDLTGVKGNLTEVRGDLASVKEIVTKVDTTGQITAKGLANLTVSSQQQFEALKAGQEELRANQGLLKIGMDELITNQENLKAGQDAIMQYLREKLP